MYRQIRIVALCNLVPLPCPRIGTLGDEGRFSTIDQCHAIHLPAGVPGVAAGDTWGVVAGGLGFFLTLCAGVCGTHDGVTGAGVTGHRTLACACRDRKSTRLNSS